MLPSKRCQPKPVDGVKAQSCFPARLLRARPDALFKAARWHGGRENDFIGLRWVGGGETQAVRYQSCRQIYNRGSNFKALQQNTHCLRWKTCEVRKNNVRYFFLLGKIVVGEVAFIAGQPKSVVRKLYPLEAGVFSAVTCSGQSLSPAVACPEAGTAASLIPQLPEPAPEHIAHRKFGQKPLPKAPWKEPNPPVSKAST